MVQNNGLRHVGRCWQWHALRADTLTILASRGASNRSEKLDRSLTVGSVYGVPGALLHLRSVTLALPRLCWLHNDLGTKCCRAFTQNTVRGDRTREVSRGRGWGSTRTALPTVMGHPDRQALVETTVLALVPVLLLDLAVAVTPVVGQLQPDGSPEETLWDGRTVGAGPRLAGTSVSWLYARFLSFTFCTSQMD